MRIDIVGKGKVGTHLVRALEDHADVCSVPSRTLKGLRTDSDLYLICVSDDAICDVAGKIAHIINRKAVLAHTSGTTPLSAISDIYPATGVFYPLQTFSKGIDLEYSEIPFFIEGSDTYTTHVLETVARLIGEKVYMADSERRKDIHIASVLSCNFVNHLWTLADNYLAARNIPFDVLLPLIRETGNKILRVSPVEAQTGPAARHDMKTISSHMEKLRDNPGLLGIYNIMTASIMNHNKAD